MKLSTLLLQIALVAAGILVYDQIRAPSADEGTASEDTLFGADNAEAAGSPTPHLSGAAMKRVDRRLETLEKRQAAIERALAEPAPAGSGAGGPVGPQIAGVSDVRESDVEWFRAVRGEVAQRDHRSAHRVRLNRQFGRLDVDLSDVQREQVIDAVYRYQSNLREQLKPTGPRAENRESRAGVMRTLRADLEQEIARIVPAGAADKVLAAFARSLTVREAMSARDVPDSR